MKKIISLVLILVLGLVVFNPVKADDLSDAQNKLKDVQKSMNDSKEKLNENKKQQDSTEQELNSLDSQMNSTSLKIAGLNKQMDDLNAQIDSSNKQIETLENNLAKQTEQFKSRARAMYMEGNVGYVEVLLDSKDFSDMISRVEFVKSLMDFDKKLISGIKTNKQDLETKKAALEKNKNSLLAVKAQVSSEYSQLQSNSDLKKAKMAQLQKDKSKYESQLKQEEADSNSLALAIKQAEEEKKKNPPPPAGPSTGGLFCVTGTKYTITSPYGWRIHPVLHTKKFHSGIDIGVPLGTPVHALKDGTVIYASWMSGYGNVVMIDHGTYISLYAHNSSLNVEVGQAIKGGQVISYSGNTGLSTGPHLHFEIRLPDGTTTDPMPYYVN